MDPTFKVLMITERSLAAMGIPTQVFAWTRSLPPGHLHSEDLPVDGPSRATITVHRMGLFANIDFSLQYSMNILEWLQQRHAFNLVWGHYLFPAGFVAVLLAEQENIASTVSARGNDGDRMMFPPGDFARLTWTLSRARSITAVSQDLARKIRLLLGGDRRVDLVPNVVDTDRFLAAPPDPVLRSARGILPDEAVLGFCGELRQKKGLTFLLQALAEVRSVRPACLLVIGEVRAREQALLSTYATEHPEAAQRILVTDALEDPSEVARHLNLCDVFLSPSLWDGLPNALLEAMACERPVLASDAGGIPEVIRHGENGFLIPKSSLDHLGTATLELLALPEAKRRAIGAAARDTIAKRYHPDVEARALETVLEQTGAFSSTISS